MRFDVAASPEIAFAFLADPGNETSWNPQAIRATPIGAHALGVGARFATIGTMMGQEMTVTVEITEFDAPRRVASVATSGPVTFHTTYDVAPTPIGATVAMDVEVASHGPLRLLQPLLARGLARRLSRLQPAIQAAIERADSTRI